MNSKTKDTIIRHLKGIVAALEKEENAEEKLCSHNKKMNEYCEPCGRIHST